MGSASIVDLIPQLQPYAQALVNLAGRAGIMPRVTSTLRTYSQQQRLYSAFTRGETKYPVAPPGTSAHEYGYAFDMVAGSSSDMADLGQVWQSWGGIWHAADEVHFEYPGFTTTAQQRVQQFYTILPQQGRFAEKACDFLLGKTWLSILSYIYGENEALQLLSNPCSTVLATLVESGILKADQVEGGGGSY